MLKRVYVAALFVLVARSVYAQAVGLDHLTPAFPTSAERKAADLASYGTVAAAVAFDLVAAWHAEDRRHALTLAAARLGVTFAVGSLIKGLTERDRPCAPTCGIDNAHASLPSLHTAYGFEGLGGQRIAIALPLAVSTGGLRIAAGKHWLTDVLAGAGLGAIVSRIR